MFLYLYRMWIINDYTHISWFLNYTYVCCYKNVTIQSNLNLHTKSIVVYNVDNVRMKTSFKWILYASDSMFCIIEFVGSVYVIFECLYITWQKLKQNFMSPARLEPVTFWHLPPIVYMWTFAQIHIFYLQFILFADDSNSYLNFFVYVDAILDSFCNT